MKGYQTETNKWQMNLAGVLNYWYYTYELFPFENGHLLIRGSNGSGKSVTTQSFLPLLLDGNKEPSRLDPFGSRSRKMIDYIFGENPDVSEKTSYLFLEYKKKHTEEYITTGIGFNAKKDSDDYKSWYFVIKNKRVGKDFNLFKYQLDESGEKVMVPFSQKELENYVDREKCGYVKVKQREYAELVNKYIYKFESLEDYLEMINLVVRIRTPKLSNDLEPNKIYQILESSLPELTLNDLRSLTETIQNIDLHNQRLEKLKEDHQLIKRLTNKYQEYNRSVLTFRATDYARTIDKQKNAEQEHKKAEKELEKTKKQLSGILEEIHSLELEQKKLKERLKTFEDNDVRKAQRKLNELKPQIAAKGAALEKQNNNLLNKEDAQKRLDASLKGKNDELYSFEKKNVLYLEELDEIAEEIDFNGHRLNRDNYTHKFDIGEDPTLAAEQWRTNLDTHIKEINGIVKLLHQEIYLKKSLEDRKAALSELDEDIKEFEKKISKLQNDLEEEIDLFNQSIMKWNDTNQVFTLEKEQLNRLITTLNGLEEDSTLYDVKSLIDTFYNEIKQELFRTKTELTYKLDSLKKETKDKKAELEQVKSKQDPEPTRNEQTVATRKELTKRKIPFVPFYEAVEFKGNMTDDEKERIESSLAEMGILDGLIVANTFAGEVTESDSILLPQELKEDVKTLDEYLDICLPKDMQSLQAEVEAILKSISIEEVFEGTYVTTFGSYQHGVVKGFAAYQKSANFIGKEARKQYKEKLIAALEEEIALLNSRQEELFLALEQIDNSTKQLNKEKYQFPSTKVLKGISEQIDSFTREIKSINNQKERVEITLQKARTEYNEIYSNLINQTKHHKLKANLEAYETASTECNNYLRTLENLRMNGLNYVSKKNEIKSINEQLEDLEMDLDNLRYSCNQIEREKRLLEETAKQLQEYLDREGIDDIERELKAAEDRLAEIPTEMTGKSEKKGELKSLIPQLTHEVSEKLSSIDFYKQLVKVRGDIFVAEVNKKFYEVFDRETLSNEEDIDTLCNLVIEELGKNTYQDVHKLQDELNVELRETTIKGLGDFHPSSRKEEFHLPDIQDEGVELFAKELDELQLTNQRTIISLMYDGKTTSPMVVQNDMVEQIELLQSILRSEDEKMYKEIIMDKIGERIRELISKAQKWKAEINRLMGERNTSNDLRLSVEWKPKEAKETDEMKTSQLINLLQRDPDTLKDTDYRRLTKHFTSKIQTAKDIYEQNEDGKKSLESVIKEVLDYRKWFEFKLFYKKGEDDRKELTKNRYNALSGGERALSMYIPLLSALFSKYGSASKEAPYVISMDEAFAGVDDKNIRDMFKLMEDLQLNYILNSQALWGDYDTVDSLSIAEILREKNSKDVIVMLYKWDGERRTEVELDEPEQKEQEDVIEPSSEQVELFELL
ncbi:TIGR02680 family protein [Pradoshia eiseniae]|uniref:TIGR02680 family protein n=1 Tax=Pradoshia eiseniae TaxID=2064768 RepID=A0A2S7MXF4_9BACI|nr:TIGR02680 family protein [Pradoshia eiseniae]PQD94418.1 TIGR02680 family protein [Pradoshia eiseniae]